MANIKSAIKRARQNEDRRLRNKRVRTRVRTAIGRFESVLTQGDLDQAATALEAAYSHLDRAARKGVIHPNKAARLKSRLAKDLDEARTA